MNEIAPSEPPRPSLFGAFARGTLSGLGSSALMIGLVAGVTALLPFAGGIAAAGTILTPAIPLVLGSGLFTGIMSAQNHRKLAKEADVLPVAVPMPTSSSIAPALSPTITYADQAPEQDAGRNWADSVSKNTDTIQKILDRGTSDKSRAEALLAVRDAAASTQTSRA